MFGDARCPISNQPATVKGHGSGHVVGTDRVGDLERALPSPGTVEDVAAVFGLLGDPGRVRLLLALVEGTEVCVHELAAAIGQSESSVSHALRLLRAHRVVVARRSGRKALYRLADEHVRVLLDVAVTHLEHTTPAPVVSESEPPVATTYREVNR